MIFSFAPHFVGTVQGVLEFLHLRESSDRELERFTPQTKQKQRKAEAAEEENEDEIEQVKSDDEDSLLESDQAADLSSDSDLADARSYESDDHEWMDTNYFRDDLVPRYQQGFAQAVAIFSLPLTEAGKFFSG